jgi:cytochrome c oxidase subunit 1
MEIAFDDKRERLLALLFVLVAIAALALGGLTGLFHALEHAGLNLFPLPLLGSYYQSLTLHGVLNALTWTTFFACGFLLIAQVASLKRGSAVIALSWLGFAVMLAGIGLAAFTVLTGNASVLFTFYVPMKASATFYIGLTLLVVGTWFHSANAFLTYRAWRKDNAGVRTPIATVGALTAWTIWDIASIGIVAEMVTVVIPWSLGSVENTNPLLARTLFWYFGQPLTTFWLIPAFVAWYAMLPKQAGGRLFSDPLARLAFMLFLVFSTATGLQNQFLDPGIGTGMKGLHFVLAYAGFLPVFMTAFTVVASLETSGQSRRSKSPFAWIFRLPWGDPSFTTQVFALAVFLLGSLGSVVSASYSLNLVVQNSTFTTGSFHLTAGTAVTLTFMGVTYWLLPYLTKRQLVSRPLALAQAWTWLIGMLLFAFGMNSAGIFGAPYRTPVTEMSYAGALVEGSRNPMLGGLSMFQVGMAMVGIGGVILVISGALYLLVVLGTLLNRKDSAADASVPLADALSGPDNAPASLDNWRLWVGMAIFLSLIAYVPVILQIVQSSTANVPGLIIK